MYFRLIDNNGGIAYGFICGFRVMGDDNRFYTNFVHYIRSKVEDLRDDFEYDMGCCYIDSIDFFLVQDTFLIRSGLGTRLIFIYIHMFY